MKKSSRVFALVALTLIALAGSALIPAGGASVASVPLTDTPPSELAAARSGTAKYHNIAQAEADGYVNIDVFVSGQGFHYLNSAPDVLDATFEADKPEILVYAPMPLENSLRLVAVEYAVPIALSPNGPPEGFTGNDDVWDRNEEFGLWTLHAWVWLNNPNGMFAEFSPRVP
jgi:hypothetical protein